MIGTTLSHYEVLEKIGQGTMGTVYRVRDTRLGRELALKVLAPSRRLDDVQRQRLVKEARAMAQVEHPGIAVVYDIDDCDGMAFIAMELLRGETLARVMAPGPLDTARALGLGIDVLEALGAVHARGLVHRDLKATNVFVDAAGRARLIDFGLVKAMQTNPDVRDVLAKDITGPGLLVGTVTSMAPEQIQRLPIDHRLDVWAFGVLFFEMLAGRPPFDGPTLAATVKAIVEEPAPRLHDVPEGSRVTAHLQSIVDRALAKDPADRFADVASLAAELRAVREGLESAARPPGPARVVLVDDDPVSRAVLRVQLSAQKNVSVVAECADGFEAVKAVNELRPDIVLLDVHMPRLDGFEVAELIGRDIGIVFVTGRDGGLPGQLEGHRVQYLVKPVEPHELAEAVGKLLRGR